MINPETTPKTTRAHQHDFLPIPPQLELPPIQQVLENLDVLVGQLGTSSAEQFAHPMLRVIQRLTADTLISLSYFSNTAFETFELLRAIEGPDAMTAAEFELYKDRMGANPIVAQIKVWFEAVIQKASPALEDNLLHELERLVADGQPDDIILEAVRDQMPPITRDPAQWTLATMIEIADWIAFITNSANWYGQPPFYVFNAHQQPFSSVPRMYARLEPTALFRFRYFVPRNELLNSAQLDEMWSHILVKEKFYEQVDTQPGRRLSVFTSIKALVPQGGTTVLDACGGTGAVITQLRELLPDNNYCMVDIASAGIALAREAGISAIHANIIEGIPDTIPQVDCALLFFTIHVLPQLALKHIFQHLKPGGSLILNVFPPGESTISYTERKLVALGFSPDKIKRFPADNGIDVVLQAIKT